MLVKILIAGLFLLILASLGSSLFFMMRDSSDSNRTVKALSWRIGLSIAAFLLLLVAGWMGYIQPNHMP